MSKHAIIYDRASSGGQANNWSREDAARVGAELAQKHGFTWELRQEIKSGETLTARPVIMGILDDITAGKVHGLICQDLTRLSRDQDSLDGLVIRQTCREHDCLVICQDRVYDFSKDDDDLAADFGFLVGKLQKKANVRAMTRGMKAKARQEGRSGGPAPLGYRLVYEGPLQAGVKPRGKLVICEPEAELVREIFALYIELGGRGAARALNDAGKFFPVKGKWAEKRGAKFREFNNMDILRITSKEYYVGIMSWGKDSQSRYMADFEPISVIKPELQIVDFDTFERAQAVHKQRATSRKAPGGWSRKYAYSGILRCPSCGAPMYGRSRKMNGQWVTVYICFRMAKEGMKCSRGSTVYSDVVNRAVMPFLAGLLENQLDTILGAAAAQMSTSSTVESIEQVKRGELAQVRDAKSRIIKAIGDGVLLQNEASVQLTELRDKESRLERDLASLAQKAEVRADIARAVQTIQDGPIETALWTLLNDDPNGFARFVRVVFNGFSVRTKRTGQHSWVGEIVSYKLTDDFAKSADYDTMGST
ncbi:MAG: recombinase family protein [Thermoflexales bacterium]|nr:recombinase family protein [Thermoflexales bacterium]